MIYSILWLYRSNSGRSATLLYAYSSPERSNTLELKHLVYFVIYLTCPVCPSLVFMFLSSASPVRSQLRPRVWFLCPCLVLSIQYVLVLVPMFLLYFDSPLPHQIQFICFPRCVHSVPISCCVFKPYQFSILCCFIPCSLSFGRFEGLVGLFVLGFHLVCFVSGSAIKVLVL